MTNDERDWRLKTNDQRLQTPVSRPSPTVSSRYSFTTNLNATLIYNIAMLPEAPGEVYISVDVETAGPNPSQYSMLTIGAVSIGRPQSSFYVELRPVNRNAVPEALTVSRLSLEQLAKHGQEPAEAMRRFEAWVKGEANGQQRPVFVAFNAPFDWMFVNDYFHRYLGRNPFGHAALDIKSLYMGLAHSRWQDTSMRNVSQRYLGDRQLTHHALRDAMDQAEIFQKLLLEAGIEIGSNK